MLIRDAIRSIGASLKRNDIEIEFVNQKLLGNWISTLSDWKSLTLEKRRQVGLPILLHHKLDELAAALSQKGLNLVS
jgi:hypothetical protein